MIHFYNDDCTFRLPQKRLVRRWLAEVARLEGGYAIESLNYIFCSSEHHRAMNVQFVGHNYFTDIITFDESDLAEGYIAGEVYIDVATVRDNARIYGTAPRQEMYRVVAHGVLHLCGQGDKTPEAEAEMHRKEERYLSLLAKMEEECNTTTL